MDYAALEDAIVTRLQPIADAGHEVRYMPSKQSQQSGLAGKARITVQAGVSKFDTANIRSTNDTTVQDEWLYIEVIIQSERLRGADGIYPVHKLARQLLLGWRPPNCELPLQAVDFEGVGPSELRDSVWTYSLRMRTRAMAMGTPDEVDETLITQITFLDSSSLGPLQPTAELYASDYNVDSSGDQVLLAWITGNADSVEIDNGIGEVVANGSMTVTITGTTTFTISATNGVNTVTDTVTVTLGSGCLNAIVSNQTGDWEEDIPSGDTWPLPYGKVKDKDGNDVQVDYRPASEGYIFEETACPAGGGSISVAVSDASPSVGDTITITGTASGYTPDSYLFFAYNTVTDEMVFLAEQASNSFNWNVSGVFAGSYELYVLGVQNGTPDITSYGFEAVTVLSNYLLDTAEGTGANFAFAFFKLRAAYTGSAALIRRSSDNAQKDFYFDDNGVLSLLSEDGSGTALGDWIGGDDGYLVTGYSQDTFGVTFTASNAADQQRVIINGALVDINGAVAMVGDNDIYVISTSLTVNSAFIVAKNDGLNLVNSVFGGNKQNLNFGGTAGGVNGIGMFDGSSNVQTTTEDLNPHLASYLTDTGIYVDGNLGVSGTITDITITRVANRSNVAAGINGKIACIVSYSTDKTADRAAIEANIDSNFTPSLLP